MIQSDFALVREAMNVFVPPPALHPNVSDITRSSHIIIPLDEQLGPEDTHLHDDTLILLLQASSELVGTHHTATTGGLAVKVHNEHPRVVFIKLSNKTMYMMSTR